MRKSHRHRYIFISATLAICGLAASFILLPNISFQDKLDPKISQPEESVPEGIVGSEPRQGATGSPAEQNAPEVTVEPASTATPEDPSLTSGLLVRVEPGADLDQYENQVSGFVQDEGVEVESISHLGAEHWFILFSEVTSVNSALQIEQLLESSELIVDGTVNQRIFFADDTDQQGVIATGTVVRTGVTWGLDRIDQRAFPLDATFESLPTEGKNVDVYIVDSGVRATHTELAGRVAPGYTAFPTDVCGTGDTNGHGTHVAGTAAGQTYGVARRSTIVPVKVFQCFTDYGDTVKLVEGINWMIAHHQTGKPAVANFSLGATGDTLVDDAIRSLIDDGVTVVVAAGNIDPVYPNDTNSCEGSPARVPEAITVGASSTFTVAGTSNKADVRASFSKYGTCSDIYAPGAQITSSTIYSDTSAVAMSGTSMASPHVAGVAALKLGERPGMSPTQVWESIKSQATEVDLDLSTQVDVQRLLFAGEPFLTVSQSSLSARVGVIISPITFSARFFDSNELFYEIRPALPSGLTLNSSSGVLSGSPIDAHPLTVYTVTATSNLQLASADFTLVVDSADIPTSQAGTPSNFVRLAYQDFLGRAPSESEVAYWAGEISAGRASQASLARTLSTSDEWVQTVIRRFYVDTLGREPDASGYQFWITQARAGMSVADIGAFFYGSDEYFSGFGAGDRETWVRDLYQKLMLRGADSGGLNYWMGLLNSGAMNRTQVAKWFYQSPEKRGLRVDALYEQFLKRGPDSGGRAYWAERLYAEGDLALASNLASSPEYYSRQASR